MTLRQLFVLGRPRVLLWAGTTACAAAFTALSILRHEAFSSGRFDLGNMVQAVWSTAHGHPLRITNLQGEQVSRLSAHFDPILALFGPLWWLWPSPSLLLTVQAATVSLGALPVFWLARKHLRSEWAALGFALAYLLYPPVQWLMLNDFHPIALACPLLLFAAWYLDENRLIPFAAFGLLAVATREEVALVVAGLGVVHALRRRRGAGIAIAAAGLALTVLTVGVIVPHFNEGNSSAFFGRYEEVGGSPGGILRTAFTDPGRLLGAAFDREGVEYLAELVLPLAGLSLLAPIALVPALPPLALNLLSATPTQTSIHFHYTAAIIPALILAAILGAGRLVPRGRVAAPAIASLVLGLSLAANYRLGPIPLWQHLPGGETLQADASRVSTHDRIAARALGLVPAAAVVSATNSLGAHLSERRRILSFPVLRDAGWIALDETKPSYLDRIEEKARQPMELRLRSLRRGGAWRTVFSDDGVLILRRARAPGAP